MSQAIGGSLPIAGGETVGPIPGRWRRAAPVPAPLHPISESPTDGHAHPTRPASRHSYTKDGAARCGDCRAWRARSAGRADDRARRILHRHPPADGRSARRGRCRVVLLMEDHVAGCFARPSRPARPTVHRRGDGGRPAQLGRPVARRRCPIRLTRRGGFSTIGTPPPESWKSRLTAGSARPPRLARQRGTAPSPSTVTVARRRGNSVGQPDGGGKLKGRWCQTSRRGERGQRNWLGAFGHGRVSGPTSASRSRRGRGSTGSRSRVRGHDRRRTRLPVDLTLDGPRRASTPTCRLLVAWNASINLTAMRVPATIAPPRLDRLAVPVLRAPAIGRILDLGSGAGYPGLPLAAPCRGPCGCRFDRQEGRVPRGRAAVRPCRDASRRPPNGPRLSPTSRPARGMAGRRGACRGRSRRSPSSALPLAPARRSRGGNAATAVSRRARRGTRRSTRSGGRSDRVCLRAGVGLAGHCLVVVDQRPVRPGSATRHARRRPR